MSSDSLSAPIRGRLTLSALQEYADKNIKMEFHDTMPHGKVYKAALASLFHFLGSSWVENNILTNGSSTNYFRTGSREGAEIVSLEDGASTKFTNIIPNETFRHHYSRVVDLAEMLFNLQDVPGIELFLTHIRKDAIQIEVYISELTSIRLLSERGYPVRFVLPVNAKKRDYDIEFLLPSGEMVCCEVETKIESSDLNETALRGKLRHAKDQLPKDKPGLIILKIPESWGQAGFDALKAQSEKFFQSTQRIVSIIVYQDNYPSTGPNTITREVSAAEYRNKDTRFSSIINRDLLLGADGTQSRGTVRENLSWVKFSRLYMPDPVFEMGALPIVTRRRRHSSPKEPKDLPPSPRSAETNSDPERTT